MRFIFRILGAYLYLIALTCAFLGALLVPVGMWHEDYHSVAVGTGALAACYPLWRLGRSCMRKWQKLTSASSPSANPPRPPKEKSLAELKKEVREELLMTFRSAAVLGTIIAPIVAFTEELPADSNPWAMLPIIFLITCYGLAGAISMIFMATEFVRGRGLTHFLPGIGARLGLLIGGLAFIASFWLGLFVLPFRTARNFRILRMPA
ncbi:MAG: hypothetical protein JKY61_09285 [Planctomycetes bacterium]|nr:hypothetical protein [Planctomycetota bacterium]